MHPVRCHARIAHPTHHDCWPWYAKTPLVPICAPIFVAARRAQYEGFLTEPGLGFHNSSADSTLTAIDLIVSLGAWADVDVEITTGKAMGVTLYTVELFQRDGPGMRGTRT